jgi:hypothetical protein
MSILLLISNIPTFIITTYLTAYILDTGGKAPQVIEIT